MRQFSPLHPHSSLESTEICVERMERLVMLGLDSVVNLVLFASISRTELDALTITDNA